jgi:phosphoribosylglycinamide formyltransferase-1
MILTGETAVGVLASGRGSNFEAILRKASEGYFSKAVIKCLISNVPSAGALETAKQARIDNHAIRPRDFLDPASYEQAIIQIMDSHKVEWLVLAGYMKIVGPSVLDRYENRILNIHPSLLPSFPGLHAQEQALNHGVRISGCTVHLVDGGLDSGPIIGQRAVAVLEADSEVDLADRILVQEHELYSECLKRITEQPWHIDGRRVIFE